MTGFEIWNCDEKYWGGGVESPEHLWPKPELAQRKRDRENPWFDGEYRFEVTVADWVPDCVVLGGPVNRWFEFVVDSDQAFWAKTRAALRFGFVIHWVFHAAHQERQKEARRALAEALKQPFRFGVYDPWTDELDVGDPITYKNFEFAVEDMTEFTPRAMLGYRAGAAEVRRYGGGFDLGMFDIGGCQRRIIAFDPRGRLFRAVAPGRSVEDSPWGYPSRRGLKRLVEAGQVTRLGPVRNRDQDS